MEFQTKYDDIKCEPTRSGSGMKKQYRQEVDKNGNVDLVCYGAKDIQADIESYRDSVDLQKIIERYTITGDSTLIERVQGFYADVTELPVCLQDVMNINIKGRELFAGLDPELKQLYGNDYVQFINDPEKMIEVLKAREEPIIETKPIEKPIEKEVKDDNPQQ